MSLVVNGTNAFNADSPVRRIPGVNPFAPEAGVSMQKKSDASPGAEKDKEKDMVMLPSGHGSGCGHCTGMMGGLIPREKLEALKAERYSAIMAHEQAHASAAGGFGGGIKIDFDSNGIAIGGSVPVQMPGINKSRPEESMKHAETVRNAALAPSDPSGQDMMVASQAQSIYSQALALKSRNENNLFAGFPQSGNQQIPDNVAKSGDAGNNSGGNKPTQPGAPQNPS